MSALIWPRHTSGRKWVFILLRLRSCPRPADRREHVLTQERSPPVPIGRDEVFVVRPHLKTSRNLARANYESRTRYPSGSSLEDCPLTVRASSHVQLHLVSVDGLYIYPSARNRNGCRILRAITGIGIVSGAPCKEHAYRSRRWLDRFARLDSNQCLCINRRCRIACKTSAAPGQLRIYPLDH